MCYLSDPVAYRVEPLLLSPDVNFNDVPPPLYLQPPGQDLRFHLKFKQMGDDIRKTFSTNKKNPWGSILETAVTVVGTMNSISNEAANKNSTTSNELTKQDIQFPLGGANKRVDYSLQTGVIDNEYVRCVAIIAK
jgi:hypothetical protein